MSSTTVIFFNALLLLAQAAAACLSLAIASKGRGLSLLGSGFGVIFLSNLASIAQVLYMGNVGNGDIRGVIGLFSALHFGLSLVAWALIATGTWMLVDDLRRRSLDP